MAGKIIADTIQAAGDRITFNVGEITVMTANSAGLTYIPTANINLNIANPGAITTGNLAVTNIVTSSLVPANSNINIGSSGTTWNIGYFNNIKFPATQQASANPNTLDDYEEGTWTPTIESDTAGTGRVTTYTSATYTKIGRQVTVTALNVTLSTLGSGGSGVFVINGLPFAELSSVSSGHTVNFGWTAGLATAASGWFGITNGSRVICRPVTYNSTSPMAANAGFSTYAAAGMVFSFSATYQTD
jgi:hypothetical protein